MNKKNNIAIIWDFDKTLTSNDSTTELIELFIGKKATKQFWIDVKEISGVDAKEPMDSISTSEAPVWMYRLSEIAKDQQGKKIALDDKGTFESLIAYKIKFYPDVLKGLKEIKNLSSQPLYQDNNMAIHHFIITAGLQDLVSSVFECHKETSLIHQFFGCKYKAIKDIKTKKIEKNIPIYCMDKTSKTRALFEIQKGCFKKQSSYKVDDFVSKGEEWCPFENMIYIGDGDTDIPAFSLVRARGGMTIGVFDPKESQERIITKAKRIRQDRRIDLFTPANFQIDKELFCSIKTRCEQITKRYEASKYSCIPNKQI